MMVYKSHEKIIFREENEYTEMQVEEEKQNNPWGSRQDNFFHDLRKSLSKICKKWKFWFVCAKFEL